MAKPFFEILTAHLQVAYDLLSIKPEASFWDYCVIRNGYLAMKHETRSFRAPVKQYIDGRRSMHTDEIKTILERNHGNVTAVVSDSDLRGDHSYPRGQSSPLLLESAVGADRYFLSTTDRERLLENLTTKSRYLCLDFGETTQSWHIGHRRIWDTEPQILWHQEIAAENRWYESRFLDCLRNFKFDSVGFLPDAGHLAIVLHQDRTGAIAVLEGIKAKGQC